MQVIFLKVSKHFATDSEQFEFVQRQSSLDNWCTPRQLGLAGRTSHEPPLTIIIWDLGSGIWDLDEPRQLGLAGRTLHEPLTIIICL